MPSFGGSRARSNSISSWRSCAKTNPRVDFVDSAGHAWRRQERMKKLIVIITVLYTVAAVAALGFISNWFRDPLSLGESVIVTTLVLGLPAVLILAIIAYWNEHNQWFTLILVVVILGSSGYVIKKHHDAYGEWLPSSASADAASRGTP